MQVLCGPPDVNKTTLLMALLKTKAIMQGADYFVCGNSLNDYGPLSLKGYPSQCKACGWDDCTPVSGPSGGKTLSGDEGKQLFTTRYGSAYPAMYMPAQFAPKTCKIFTTNIVITRETTEKSDFATHFDWIEYLIRGDADKIKAAGVDAMAQARRAAVVYIDKPLIAEAVRANMQEEENVVIAEQMNRLPESVRKIARKR